MATATPRIAAGATLRCADGRLILLGREVKRGGAGTVHLLPQAPQQVAKIYHPGSDLARAERKLAAMLALSPELPDIAEHGRRYVQIAWPQAMLHDEQQRFVGFLMPTLDLALTSELECVLQERQARKLGLPTGLGARVTLAANLAAVVAELHRRGHRVIDLKPVNLRFYPASLYLAVLDCDGFAIAGAGERFPAEQVTPDYLAPELQRRALGADDEEPQDRFALAVMVFQLLNHGIHPYAGKPLSERVPTDLPGRIAGGYYGYGVTPHAAIAATPGSSHELIPSPLREAFDRSFAKTATRRVAAAEWRDLLRDYATRSAGRLVVCARHPEHQHFAGYDCGSCRRAERIRQVRAKPTTPRGAVAGSPPPPAMRSPLARRAVASSVTKPMTATSSVAPTPLATLARRRARPSGVLKVRALRSPGVPNPLGAGAATAISPPVRHAALAPGSSSSVSGPVQGPPIDLFKVIVFAIWAVGVAAFLWSLPTSRPYVRPTLIAPAPASTALPPKSTLPIRWRMGVPDILALPYQTGWRREFVALGDRALRTGLHRAAPLPSDRPDVLTEHFGTADSVALTLGTRLPVGTRFTLAWYRGLERVNASERMKTREGFEQFIIPFVSPRASEPGDYRVILLVNEAPIQAIDFEIRAATAGAPVEVVPPPSPCRRAPSRRPSGATENRSSSTFESRRTCAWLRSAARHRKTSFATLSGRAWPASPCASRSTATCRPIPRSSCSGGGTPTRRSSGRTSTSCAPPTPPSTSIGSTSSTR